MRLFRKKISLRDACRIEHGDEFVKAYDAINEGCSIGGFLATAMFINSVEEVKNKYIQKGYKVV